MISAAARPKLGPRLVAETTGDRRNRPVVVHHIVITAVLEGAANPETRFAFDDVSQPVALTGDDVRLAIINGELHPAGDINTDGIRNHGIFCGKNATNRQAVARVGIRHQRPRHGDGQCAGVRHLPHGIGFQIIAPLTPRREFRPRRERRAIDGTGEGSTQRICEKRRWIGDNLEDLLAQPRAFVSIRDVALDEFVCVLDRLARRHAEENEVFGFHDRIG